MKIPSHTRLGILPYGTFVSENKTEPVIHLCDAWPFILSTHLEQLFFRDGSGKSVNLVSVQRNPRRVQRQAFFLWRFSGKKQNASVRRRS